MLLDEERTLSNYILSLKEAIRLLQPLRGNPLNNREILSEINTLQIVKDDLQLILNKTRAYKTYWITYQDSRK